MEGAIAVIVVASGTLFALGTIRHSQRVGVYSFVGSVVIAATFLIQ